MSVETMQLFFAMLALLLAGFVVLSLIGLVVARSATLHALSEARSVALELAAAVAVTSTAGSLYMSEVAGYEPCYLCWVQRAFMYPAALLLVAALVTKTRWPALVAAGLALLGLPVSIFHRTEQAVGGFGDFCDPNNPCSGKWVEEFGFVTIPTMAGIGFAGILFFVGLSVRSSSITAGAHAQVDGADGADEAASDHQLA